MSKYCRRYLREVDDKRLYCGVLKTFPDGSTMREFCPECSEYAKGFEDGYNKKIEEIKKCCMITCSKPAKRYINVGEYIIEVCPIHAHGRDSQEMKNE